MGRLTRVLIDFEPIETEAFERLMQQIMGDFNGDESSKDFSLAEVEMNPSR